MDRGGEVEAREGDDGGKRWHKEEKRGCDGMDVGVVKDGGLTNLCM